MAFASEQGAQTVDGGEKVAAVALHHREEEIAAGMTAQPRVLGHRQTSEQHVARLALVSRERQRAAQHVAGGQHAKLVAQLTGAPAAVEHGHDGMDEQPGIGFETTEEARQTRAPAEASDVQRTKLHEVWSV